MTTKWRPEGWIDQYYKTPEIYSFVAYEAGADAMLVKLRMMGHETDWTEPSGQVVFIPDDPQPEKKSYESPCRMWNKNWFYDIGLGLTAEIWWGIFNHKATKVIEYGSFCMYCGTQIPISGGVLHCSRNGSNRCDWGIH
jgi:hypothetical protein